MRLITMKAYTVFQITYLLLCFTLSIFANYIRDHQTFIYRTVHVNAASLEKQKRAINTLAAAMLTTVCFSAPILLLLMGDSLTIQKRRIPILTVLSENYSLLLFINLLGQGVNSNILLCRNSKIALYRFKDM